VMRNKFGELVFSEDALLNLLMKSTDIGIDGITSKVKFPDELRYVMDDVPTFRSPADESLTVEEYDRKNQQSWAMPEEYKNMDIAAHVLSLCQTDAERQRCGKELLLFQERGMMTLLCYIKYLMDLVIKHGFIIGVGRGSSVSSYVLYLMGVHKINSMYYDLDVEEFLR
jgi:DNA polymerase III alpha subunit